MKIVELHKKTADELISLLDELTKEHINLKIKKSVGQLSMPHRLLIVRRNIARVKTLIGTIRSTSSKSQIEKSEVT